MSKFSIEALKPGYHVYFPFGSSNSVYIQPTANGWWSDQAKVNQFLLITGIDGTIDEACAHIGITLKQYKYFIQLHPEFRELRKAYAVIPTIQARQSIMKAIGRGDSKTAMWLLERKHPEEFSLPAIRKNRGLRNWEEKNKPPVLTPAQIRTLERIAGIRNPKEES